MRKATVLQSRYVSTLIAAQYVLMIGMTVCICYFLSFHAAVSVGRFGSVIVVDPGHGGVDGGTGDARLLEKDINLAVSLKLKTLLEQKGYTVLMTRGTDVALDNLNNSSSSRHLRDLNARVGIINGSGARIFLSIHVNSLAGDSVESGSLVFYGRRFKESRILASFIQDALNGVKAGGRDRERHAPLPGRYYLLSSAYVPGVIIETAFITNRLERELLASDDFLSRLAAAIATGADAFLDSEGEK